MGVIEEVQKKGGEAYSDTGKRNPIRRDTNELLTALVMAANPSLILEVGTAYGVSALCMAQGLQEGGHILTFEFDQAVALQAQQTFEAQGLPITVVAGRFEEVFTDPGVEIDFVFLDAEKSLYLKHFNLMEPHLSQKAVILADNVTDRQAECQDFLDYMQLHYRMVIVPTQCGLLVATR